MIKKLFAAAAFAAMAILAGCGGGGSNPVTPPTSQLTKDAVLQLLKTGVAQGGDLKDADGGQARSATRGVKQTREDVDKWFDEFLGIWVVQKLGNNDVPNDSSGYLYFVDEALTQSAGHDLMWMSEPGVSPMTGKSELIYTAGLDAGVKDVYEWSINEDGSGSSKGEGTDPEIGAWKFSGTWTVNGLGTFAERFDSIEGWWQEYTYKDNEDLSYDLTINSSQGVKFDLHFNVDGDGTGTISGNATGLPATITWNVEGAGVVTWSDGTTSEVNIYELVQG